jgi:hypothetical protein
LKLARASETDNNLTSESAWHIGFEFPIDPNAASLRYRGCTLRNRPPASPTFFCGFLNPN